MAATSLTRPLLRLTANFGQLNLADPLTQCLTPSVTRSMATVVGSKTSQTNEAPSSGTTAQAASQQSRPQIQKSLDPTVLTTLHQWPSLEPTRFAQYSSQHLNLPLRRDILHRAVVFEGDATRLGTASTKWRDDVRGSGRKIKQQKGTGTARVGDKMSPTRRGGGVAHGPHPRDFSTELNRKIYDLAWRTALSYRWRKGELLIVENTISMPWQATPHLLNNIFETNKWGKGFGRSTLITLNPRERLMESMEQIGHHGLVKDVFDVDVKNLLETGRIVIERFALDALLGAHSSDLGSKINLDMSHRIQQDLAKQYREDIMAAEAIADAEFGAEIDAEK